MLIILLSTYLPQTIGLYVTIILGLGADVYSLILTMVLVGSFLLLIWRLKKKKMLFIFEKKSWNWSFVFYLFATYVVYQILGNFWARYAHLINHRNIHDEYFTVLFSNGQPTFFFFNLQINRRKLPTNTIVKIREFAPYMRQGALNSYIDAWKYGFRAG
ncbi:caax amino protease family protein [Streptococcus pneumoniae]|nr:caax amino protease family protein [Streptococcus pneumoniae]